MADDSSEGATDVVTTDDVQSTRLNLDVNIEKTGTCQRHVRVIVPAEDVERYFGNIFGELEKDAQVPGFRPGKVPRRIIERKFRRDAATQVKSSIVVDALTQLAEEQKLAAIGEPDFDIEKVDVTSGSAMEFEFDIEVRPEFDLPDWKGLKIKRPVHEFTDEDVNHQLERLLASRGNWNEKDGPAEAGDRITADIKVTSGEESLSEDTRTLKLLPKLAFFDGTIEGFDEKLAGIKAGEMREVTMTISEGARNEKLRGQEVTVRFVAKKVESLEKPELNEAFFETIGLENEEALRDAIKKNLERQLSYRQNQAAREQVLNKLRESVDLDLPPDLLKKQSQRELYRAVLELQSAGFTPDMIRAQEALLRQNINENTASSLKQHFVLERIAEDEGIDATEQDVEMEIYMIASQRGENPRKVRADIEKSQQDDALRNQIVERKVLAKIVEAAEFEDEPYEVPVETTESVDYPAAGFSVEPTAEKAEAESTEG